MHLKPTFGAVHVWLQSYDERVGPQDLKSDSTFMMPYNYHHHQHQSQQQQQQQPQPQPHPPSLSQARQCLDRSTDRLQPSAGHLDAADLIDLSRSRRVVAATDERGRPSAAVHPHRSASTIRGSAIRPRPVSFPSTNIYIFITPPRLAELCFRSFRLPVCHSWAVNSRSQ